MLVKLRKPMQRKNGEQGFTLVELIVVMAILALLAALAVPKFGNILSDSKTKAHNANVKMIQQAVDLYATNTDTALTDIDNINTLVPDYLKAVPDNPTDGAAYTVTDGVVSPGTL